MTSPARPIAIILLSLALSPAALAKGKPMGPEAAAKLKAQGDDAKAAGKMNDAAKFYKSAVEADPSNTGNVEDYGKTLFTLGKYKDAVELFRNLTTRADDPAAYWNLGYAQRKSGDYKGAAESYAAYVKNVPEDTDGYYQLAECLRKIGQFADAAAEYDAYVAKETRSSEQQWIDKAKAKASEMRAAAPTGSAPTVVAMPTPAPAATETPTVVAMPTPAPAPAPAATEAPTVVAMPTPAAAPAPAPMMAPVAARDPTAAVGRIREGDSLFKQQRFREALFAYQDAVKLDDQSTNALLKEGLAYANMNYFQEAVTKWQRVLELDPKNAYAPKYIEKAKPRLGQSVAAADSAAPQPVQGNNVIPTSIGATSAPKQVTAEDEAAAKDLYRKAVQMMNTQQYDGAVGMFGNAIDRNPRYVNAYIGRAGANFGGHKYSDAIADYQRALQLNPSLATPIYGLGRSYERMGDKINACVQYRRYVGSAAVDAQPNLKKQAQDQLSSLCGG